MTITSQIQFVQGATVGTPGQSLFVVQGTSVVVSNGGSNTGANRWVYTVLWSPPGSSVPIGVAQDSSTLQTWSFTPDTTDGFTIQLDVYDGSGNKATDVREASVKRASGRHVPGLCNDPSVLNFAANPYGWAPYIHPFLDSFDRSTTQYSPPTLAAGLNSNVPTNRSPNLKLTLTAASSLGGLVAPQAGDATVVVVTWAGFALTVVNEDSSSSAANRIRTQRSANVVCAPRVSGGTLTLAYDFTISRWELTSSGYSAPRTLDVTDFGAAVDGVTDDTNAWDACLLQASLASGPVSIEMPSGASIVKPTSNGQTLFTVPSNVRIQGQGIGTSIIRVSSTTTVNYQTIFGVSSTSNVKFRDLTIDQNPQSTGATPNGSMYAIYGTAVTRLRVESCAIDYCGSNSINVSGASKYLWILDNYFSFSGSGLVGYDNSVIYTHAAYQYVLGNYALGTSVIPSSTTAGPIGEGGYEVHLGPGVIANNVAINYSHGMNVVGADGTDAPGTVGGNFQIFGNRLEGVSIGILLWTVFQGGNAYGLSNVKIHNNSIFPAQHEWNLAAAAGVIPAGTANVSNGSASVSGSGTSWSTSLAGLSAIQFASQPGVNYTFTINSNTSLTLGAVYSGTSNTATSIWAGGNTPWGISLLTGANSTTLYDNIEIDDNTISYEPWVAGQSQTPGGAVSQVAGIYLSTAATYQHVTVSNNKVRHSPGRGISVDAAFGTATANGVSVFGNKILNPGTDISGPATARVGVYHDKAIINGYFDNNEVTFDALNYPSSATAPYSVYVNPSSATNVIHRAYKVASSAPSGAATPGYFIASVAGLVASLSTGVGTAGSSGILDMGSTFTLGQHVGGGQQIDMLNLTGSSSITQLVANRHKFAQSSGGTPQLDLSPNGMQFGGIGIPCGSPVGGVIAAAAYPFVRLVPTGTLSTNTTLQITVGTNDTWFELDLINLTFAGFWIKLQVGTSGGLWGPTSGGAGITSGGVYLVIYNVSANAFRGILLS